jgi:hypothetical protein
MAPTAGCSAGEDLWARIFGLKDKLFKKLRYFLVAVSVVLVVGDPVAVGVADAVVEDVAVPVALGEGVGGGVAESDPVALALAPAVRLAVGV